MKKINRSEILDLGEYERIRPHFLKRMITLKKVRRIAVGPNMTFIFENRNTVLFQIQEMLRIERITDETAIVYEIETYNSLIPAQNELFATLMVEFDDANERKAKLEQLSGLKDFINLSIENHVLKSQFEYLPGKEEDRTPAINYLRFSLDQVMKNDFEDRQNLAFLRINHPHYTYGSEVLHPLREQLLLDLG